MRIVVEISDTDEGMFEGTVAPSAGEALPFHGTLELIAILEALVDPQDVDPPA